MNKKLQRTGRLLVTTGILAMCGLHAKAQVTVVATAGVMGPTAYTTLGAAFADINGGLPQGDIVIAISASTTEAGPCVLNSSGAGSALYTSVLIRPATDGVSVSATTTSGRGVIELKGADNVTIDGDNPNTPGTNRNLSIINTAASTVTYASCVRICNAATVVVSSDNNTIMNCILTGNASGRNAAGITSTTGSENTTFGIYSGGNGGATATDAPAAVTSVTTNTAPAGTTINALTISNNQVSNCARGIVFNGANSTVSTGVTISNNVVGASGTLVGTPPFTTPSSTVYTKGIWVSGTNAVTISGNTVQNQMAYVGTLMTSIELVGGIGSGTLSITGNTINGLCANSSTSTSAVKAILVASAGGPYTVSGNNITNVQGILSGFGAGTTVVGIESNSTAASATIELNKITQVYNRNAGSTGAFGINILGGNNITIKNNFISDLNQNMSGGFTFDPQYAVVGIRINSGTGHKVHYNSINLTGTLIGTAASDLLTAGFSIGSTLLTGCDVRNNIFSNTLSGGTTNLAHVSIFLPSGGTSAMNLTLNNNVYYSGSTASQGIGQAGTTVNTGFYTAANFNPASTTPATNLRSYTSTLSVAGTNDNLSSASTAAAAFTSLSDLHINNALPTAIDVDGKAAVIAGITTDIDANTRDVSTPDIGADEFAMPACVASNGGTITPASYTRCAGQTVSLSSTGYTSGLGITYQWQVAAVSGGPYTNVTGGSGANTPTYITAALAPGIYYYVLAVTCSTGPSTGLSNQVTVTVNALPTVGATPGTSLYCAPGTPVTLTGSGASTYAWSPSGSLSSPTGTSVDATPSANTTYTVIGTDANGCTGTATATVNYGPAVTGLTVSATASTICAGDTFSLNSTASGFTAVILSENFNSGAPSWTRTNLSTGGTPANAAWTDRPDGYVYAGGTPYHSNDNSQFVQSNSDAQGSGSTTNTRLQSPAFSTTGYTGITVAFYQFYRDIADPGDSAVVEASLDGISWTIAGAYTASTGSEAAFSAASVNLPAGFNNQATVYVRFRYIGTWDWYWSIDNVTVSGTSNNFTYNWTSAPIGFTSSVQNPSGVSATASTVYTAQFTNTSGCSATANVSVTVNPLPTVVANTTATAVCAGTNVTLTGSGATTYTWDNSVTDGVAFTPVSTTSYMVTGTDANGCTDTDMITVTVNALPTVVANTTATAVCAGTNVTLTGSGATSYTWDNSVTDGVAFTPTATMNYIVSGTDANGCINYDTIGVTVNTLPGVIANASATSVCAGNSVTLNGSGAVSYTWDNSVTDGVAFTPASTLSYIVTGTDANGCSNNDTITVTVNALPSVTANTSAAAVCAGDSVTLTGSGAVSYTWDNSVTDGVAFVPTSTLSYIVSGTDANGCSNNDTVTVTVNALPSVSASFPTDTICLNGGVITLSGESPAGGVWSGSGVSGNSFDPAVPGVGTVPIMYMYTDSNGCAASDTQSLVVDVCAGIITHFAGTSVSIYPNPNQGLFTIELGNAATAVKIDVLNNLGQSLGGFMMNGNLKQVDLSTFEKGIYFIRITEGQAVSVHRVVIQ